MHGVCVAQGVMDGAWVIDKQNYSGEYQLTSIKIVILLNQIVDYSWVRADCYQ